MKILEKYIDVLSEGLKEAVRTKEPVHLYEPIEYIVSIGGKRIRPALTLMTADFLGADYHKALPAAMAVEMFHNFSLIHDDIMDDAPLRRGHQTVHEKWDVNTGILSGDAMLILAYRLFEKYESPKFRDLAKLFSKTALEVCEGQQLDMDFESRDDVILEEYLKMIEQKTAVLLGAAMQMGAIVADASPEEQNRMFEFGRNLGVAFQLQDDFLDAFGDPETFGKQVGGDIIENKKTILYIMAMEKGDEKQKRELFDLFSNTSANSEEKVERAKELFTKTGALAGTQEQIKRYGERAFSFLEAMQIPGPKKLLFKEFGEDLMERRI